MPRGGFDFGSINALYAANQMDTAEIQYSISGFSFIDGLGRTILMDNFKNGLGMWQMEATAGANSPRLIDRNFNQGGVIFSPPYAIYCLSSVTDGSVSAIKQSTYQGNQQKFGIEGGFYIFNNSSDIRLYIEMTRLDMVTKFADIRISPLDGVIYLKSVNLWQSAGTFDKPVGSLFYRLQAKLTVNFDTLKYDKLLLGEVEYDLSTYALNGAAAGIAGVVVYQLGGWGRTGANVEAYIGMIRCTKDEP